MPMYQPIVASAYLGQVATRGKIPEQKYGPSTNQISSRIFHKATASLKGAQLRYVNFYGTAGVGTGSAATVTASIEYPVGTTPQRVTFSASNSAVIADAGDVWSDPLPFDVPAGAIFIEHNKFANTTGFARQLTQSTVDKAQIGASTTDNTGTGSQTGMVASGSVYGFTEVRGQTDQHSLLFLGDSTFAGSGDNNGYQTNAIGACERAATALGLAFVNFGVSGAPSWNWKTNSNTYTGPPPASITDVMNRVSAIILCSSINDINGGSSAAAFKSDLEGVIALWNPGGRKPFYLTTVPPLTTSTDSWATAANQTIPDAPKEAVRVAHNLAVRRNQIVGMTGVVDFAACVEDPANPGKWLPFTTVDGTHPSTYGYNLCLPAFPALGGKVYL